MAYGGDPAPKAQGVSWPYTPAAVLLAASVCSAMAGAVAGFTYGIKSTDHALLLNQVQSRCSAESPLSAAAKGSCLGGSSIAPRGRKHLLSPKTSGGAWRPRIRPPRWPFPQHPFPHASPTPPLKRRLPCEWQGKVAAAAALPANCGSEMARGRIRDPAHAQAALTEASQAEGSPRRSSAPCPVAAGCGSTAAAGPRGGRPLAPADAAGSAPIARIYEPPRSPPAALQEGTGWGLGGLFAGNCESALLHGCVPLCNGNPLSRVKRRPSYHDLLCRFPWIPCTINKKRNFKPVFNPA